MRGQSSEKSDVDQPQRSTPHTSHPKAILKLMKAEEKLYSGEAGGKYFTAR